MLKETINVFFRYSLFLKKSVLSENRFSFYRLSSSDLLVSIFILIKIMEGQSSLSSYMHMLAAGYPLMYEVNPEPADLTDTSVGKFIISIFLFNEKIQKNFPYFFQTINKQFCSISVFVFDIINNKRFWNM